MKRILSIFLVIVLLFSLCACSASKTTDEEPMKEIVGGDSIGSNFDSGIIKEEVYGESIMNSAVADDMASVDGESGSKGSSESGVVDTPQQTPEYIAGTLTAGEWKDLENIEFWTKLLNRNDWYQLMEDRNLFANTIIPVEVKDQEGHPCYNAKVSIIDKEGRVLYNAVSDASGMAYLFYNLDGKKGEVPECIVIGEQKFPIDKDGITKVKVDKFTSEIMELDLMLMVDTTGSMSDELTYLQKELESVIKKVSDTNKTVSINVSVNFYRDEDDEYVIKPFEFTNKIDDVILQLNAQRTDGGGDYPEAVHKALNNIVNEHQWRSGAVKLCFFVLDAPPHTEQEIQGINANMTKYIQTMAEKGIRLIPIASSGVNTETEFLLRSWAAMTGGTYTFLTDHSGVGNSHLEPTIGDYEVEKLNNLMFRLINEYLGGMTIKLEQ